MVKNKFVIKSLLIAFLSLIILIIALKPADVLAVSKSSTINTSYVLIDSLSDGEKQSLIKGEPKVTIANDIENFVLVYQPPLNQPIQTTSISTTHTATLNELPKTGDAGVNKVVLLSGVIIFLAVVIVLIKNRKNIKQLLLLLSIVGGMGLSTHTVHATTKFLPDSTQTTVDKGISYSPSTSIDGYEFLGYIHNIENVTPITSSVTIRYQDSDGQTIAPDVIKTGEVGDVYSAEQKEIDGYTFKEVSGNMSGVFAKEPQVIVVNYIKQGVITLKQSGFIDTKNRNGNNTPTYYKLTYYDSDFNKIKSGEIHSDTILTDEKINVSIGSPYSVYTLVTYDCYSVLTDERLYWGDYQLYAVHPEQTKGIMNTPSLTIDYSIDEFQPA